MDHELGPPDVVTGDRERNRPGRAGWGGLETTMTKTILAAVALAGAIGLFALPAQAERIKDITDIKGVRSNPLQGYGLIVGLNGTGDGSPVSQRMLTNLLRQSGLVFDQALVSSKNIAFVTVTAELGPFSRSGTTLDVEVAAAGGAISLQGGSLLMTPLRGADGQVYAVAQGPVVLGGFGAAGAKSSVTQNHTTAGRIPNGASVEREELATVVDENNTVTFHLRNPDFSTAEALRTAINVVYPASAETVDPASIRVRVPRDMARRDVTAMVDRIGGLEVKVDTPAIVIINERTGTIVVGQNVGISMVGISHGNLSIITRERESVSQPQPFSGRGTSEKTQETEITAVQEGGALHVVPRQVSVSELARALNAMGLTPRDLIAIFTALKQSGALQAQLKVM
jgi:flagellar P-ring protein FlgI